MIIKYTFKYVLYNKQCGTVCQGYGLNLMLRSVVSQFAALEPTKAVKPQDFRPVHRLDKNVSGVMMIARDQEFARKVANSLAGKQSPYRVTRRYVGLLNGVVPSTISKSGTIALPVPVYTDKVAQLPTEGTTHYHLLPSVGSITPVVLQLDTGRKYQIRSHCLDFFGLPLVNDLAFRAFQKGQSSVDPGQIGLHLGYFRLENTKRVMEEVTAPITNDPQGIWTPFIDSNGDFKEPIRSALANFNPSKEA